MRQRAGSFHIRCTPDRQSNEIRGSRTMQAALLEVENLVKQYATVRAVDALGFAVAPGEIVALLGPNGAGKTSTVRMLIGLTRPDSGRIVYRGRHHDADRVLPEELGYLPEERGLYLDQPVAKVIVYLAGLRGMPAAAARAATTTWLERLGLGERAKEKVSALSKGNQQKVQLIASVIHQPRLAILDEPFSGFDPVNQELTVDLIRGLREQGMTVLLSAHQMALVERLADRVLLMNRGREVLAGTMAELRQRSGLSQRLTLEFAGVVSDAELARLPGVVSIERQGPQRAALLLGDNADLNALLAGLGAGAAIRNVQSDPIGLHEIYLRAVGSTAPAPNAPQSTTAIEAAA
jgi:ABC-2 type transport system ATP-binding protein